MAPAARTSKKARPLRILVTNDDGIHARGLESAEKIARAISPDVWVVAPETEQSGASHALTLSHPLRIRQISDRRFAVAGTPTDCVLMAMLKVMKETPPDLVISGVNRGSNIADDVTYSGTIAGAMEGCTLGVPSIALSQAYGFDGHVNVKWSTAEHHGPAVIQALLAKGWPADVLININFPDVKHDAVKGVRVTAQGKRDQSTSTLVERVDARGNPYFWLGFMRILSNPASDTDLRAVYDGWVSVTPLHLDLTHHATREGLEAALKGVGTPAAKRGKKPAPKKKRS